MKYYGTESSDVSCIKSLPEVIIGSFISYCIYLWTNATVVRALASHQCGPGSNPGVDALCGLSCCWFSPLLREVFLRVLQFSPLLKNQHLQIPIRSGTHGHV